MRRTKHRVLLPTAGVVAAVATAASGWAPVSQASPDQAARDTGLRQPASTRADGTFESCGAYFGFGKQSDGVLDVVDFDVADQNGDDGASHSVETDTPVVLVLTNEEGDTLECTPVEVTEEDWDAAMADLQIPMPEGKAFPAWPGPGHYAYPSTSFDPFVEGFGDVVDVGFRVVEVPDGHTLVSPTDVKVLVQHYITDDQDYIYFGQDPRVLDLIEATAEAPADMAAAAVDGPSARAAFVAALAVCDDGGVLDPTPDLVAAVNALRAYRGFDALTADQIGCFDVGSLNADSSLLLGIEATRTYLEPIALALPTQETTSTTTSTTTTVPTGVIPDTTQPPPANAVPGSPTYTG